MIIMAHEIDIEKIDGSTPWRNYASELTDKQRELVESVEARYRQMGTLDGSQARQDLLEFTLDYVNGNRVNADFAHVAVPALARADVNAGWERCLADNTYDRSLTWHDFETGDERIDLDISGRQSTDGTFTRHIQMYSDTVQLTVDGARRLAAALTEAADELARLERLQ